METTNLWGEVADLVILRPSDRGRNARGLCLHKRTTGAKRAKGQAEGGLRPSGRGSSLRIRKARR